MFGLGVGELVVVGIILLFFFGPKKLPELGKGIGQAIREFKKSGQNPETETEEKEKLSIKNLP